MKDSVLENINIWSPEIIVLIIVSGFLVGVVNTLAGSGTAISYAVFMLLGLPPSYANGTVRIGVITQTLAASINFYRKNLFEIKRAFFVAIPITLGSMTGAEIAVNIDRDIFRLLIGGAMIVMLFFVFYKPERWINGKRMAAENARNKWWHIPLYFIIGVYGGFIHIGVGIFLLSSLVLVSGYDLLHANSLKVFIVFIYSPFALAVFIINGDIHYGIGLIAVIGNTLGGIFASNYAMQHGAGALRWVLVIVLALFSCYLFGVFDFFWSLSA